MLNLGNIHRIQKGKIPLATLEELESEDTMVSIDGDRVF
jgi:hypothetical protein